jgi:hypothetical protein
MPRRSARDRFLISRVSGPPAADPFATDPIRRSLAVIVVCVIALVAPWLAGDNVGTATLFAYGWLAAVGIVFSAPVLVLALAEETVTRVRRRLHPPIEELGLPSRIERVLRRHGMTTIADVEATTDDDLLLLANMDERSAREVRRRLTLWRYDRWQASGFAERR